MGKYFKYAVGEILLVVIGILIALQINNWNEYRKALNDEKATIASLKLEFERNLKDLEVHTKDIQGVINAGNALLEHTGPEYEDGNLQNVDSLIAITFRLAVWDPSLYTLSNIKSSGKISSLSNKTLKEQLIEWDSFFSNLNDWHDFYVSGGHRYFEFIEQNGLMRNLTVGSPYKTRASTFELSNEQLLRQASYENALINRVINNNFILMYYKQAKQKQLDIIKQCETYEN